MSPLAVALPVVAALLVAATGLALVRLARGPTLPDRIVALDLVATVCVGIIAVVSVITGERAYLRAAIVLALLAFAGTVAFARYVERRGAE